MIYMKLPVISGKEMLKILNKNFNFYSEPTKDSVLELVGSHIVTQK